jgi:DNA-binding MarR family transcriptional regulator
MQLNSDALLDRLRQTVVGIVREHGPDPTARQLAVFLTAHLDEGPHTVARVAARLGLQKAAVSRAIDRLVELRLARREADRRDRRLIHIAPTESGGAFLHYLGLLMASAVPPANDNRAQRLSEPQAGRSMLSVTAAQKPHR